MQTLREYFELRSKIAELVKEQNSLVHNHYHKVNHVSHVHIWVEDSKNNSEQGEENISHKSMDYYIDDDSSIDSLV